MADTSSTRKCGHCGTSVDAGAVTCPACDVLLAAYESPDGSVFSTDAATRPVDMTETPEPAPPIEVPDLPAPIVTETTAAPTTSPTSDTLSALQERGATRPSFDLPQQSPIAKAMEETKAAVDATPQPTSDAEREAIASIIASADDLVRERQEALNVPEEYRDEPDLEDLGFDVDQEDDDDDPEPPAPARASQPDTQPKPTPPTRDENTLPPSQSSVVNKVRAQAAAGWYDENRNQPTPSTSPRERPSPSRRADSRRQPVRATALSEPKPTPADNKSKIGAWIVGGLIVVGILSQAGSAVGLVVPVIVFMLLWYMVTMSKSTGRKTTAIPRDRRPR